MGAGVKEEPVALENAGAPGADVTDTRAPPNVHTNTFLLGFNGGTHVMTSDPAVYDALAPFFSSCGVLVYTLKPKPSRALSAIWLTTGLGSWPNWPMWKPESST